MITSYLQALALSILHLFSAYRYDGVTLHHLDYDFNDSLIPIGVASLIKLLTTYLGDQ